MDKIRQKIASLNTQLNFSTNCQAHSDGSEKNNQKNCGLHSKKIALLSPFSKPLSHITATILATGTTAVVLYIISGVFITDIFRTSSHAVCSVTAKMELVWHKLSGS